jgi:large subunit ribosomal protein L19e
MDLKVQKRLAAHILNCSPKHVVFDNDRLDDIKQAITKRDLRLLSGEGAISKMAPKGSSKSRARKLKIQKSKGRRKGEGSKKGSFNARFDTKRVWMNNLRYQRAFLKMLVTKSIITKQAYRELYLKSKGGYFRSKRHIQIYLQEHDVLLVNKDAVKAQALAAENAAKADKKSKRVINNKS